MSNHFDASVAEVGSNDAHQRAEIGFSLVGNNPSLINSRMDKLLDFSDALGLAEMIDSEIEMIHL